MKKAMIQPSVIMKKRDYETVFELWSLAEYVVDILLEKPEIVGEVKE